MTRPESEAAARLAAETRIAFERHFDAVPDHIATAPGRVNLLGEHTDYNGGFVLPMALDLYAAAAIGPGREETLVEAYSRNLHKSVRATLSAGPKGFWADYVLGSLQLACKGISPPPGLRIALDSTVPIGAGVSSSAALEVAVLRAARAHFDLPLDDVALAGLGRRAENEFVGMPCGIMDQMVASVGVPGAALFLDTRSLDFEPVALPDGYRVITAHCGVAHKLVADGYETRVRECRAACAALGVAELRDLGAGDLDRVAGLEAPLDRRARHVVTENARVLAAVEALKAGDAAAFGKLMIESHASQRDDYDVSIPEIDALVEGALEAGALGARLTGGGFGGSIVALVEANRAAAWREAVARKFPKSRLVAET